MRLGDGAGGFSGTTSVAVGNFAGSVALGDLDGSAGLPDLGPLVPNQPTRTFCSEAPSYRKQYDASILGCPAADLLLSHANSLFWTANTAQGAGSGPAILLGDRPVA